MCVTKGKYHRQVSFIPKSWSCPFTSAFCHRHAGRSHYRTLANLEDAPRGPPLFLLQPAPDFPLTLFAFASLPPSWLLFHLFLIHCRGDGWFPSLKSGFIPPCQQTLAFCHLSQEVSPVSLSVLGSPAHGIQSRAQAYIRPLALTCIHGVLTGLHPPQKGVTEIPPHLLEKAVVMHTKQNHVGWSNLWCLQN